MVAELFQELVSDDPAARPAASEVVERLEALNPAINRNGSVALSAGSSLPGSLPSVDSRGHVQPWAQHRRNVST